MQTRFTEGDSVLLGAREGRVVAGTRAVGGQFVFLVGGGEISGEVFKARGPDVRLDGCQVWLLQEVVKGQLQARYAVMVDDVYWGIRIQPAVFTEAPFTESFVMGYRLKGQVLQNGVALGEANVSLEVRLQTEEDGEVVFWDSEEYNELVYSQELETWVEGPNVLAPVRTDNQGQWELIVPKGHGAPYQRAGDFRDESAETRSQAPRRYVTKVYAVHRGQRALAAEGQVAVIDLESAGLEITGTPGAFLRVGTLDDTGVVYEVPSGGVVLLEGLPCCEHSIVQFLRTSEGAWDPTWGCPRQLVRLEAGTTTAVTMAPLEQYPPETNIVAGRVYERFGKPAAGIAIQIIDVETYEVIGTAAVTDDGGFWSAEIPEGGFGGELFIHDPEWGSVPVLGSPYSDIVLGARAYSSWFDEFRPEAWRRGSFGHKNFPYVPGALWVEDAEAGSVFKTAEVEYGGWVTINALPKYRYVADLQSLIEEGPQLRAYNVVADTGVLEEGFALGSQPFEDYETPPGLYRAAGHYPEAKFVFGGKMHGNVLLHSGDRVDEELPEAARMGLEFGRYQALVEMRSGPTGERCEVTSFAGFVCPYCGGPGWRDPAPGPAEQGYCEQCATVFGDSRAMDCRTFFRTPTVRAGARFLRACVPYWDEVLTRTIRYHWRPDVYEETDAYVTQSGPGQRTDAPRWFAKHIDAFGDGLGFGKFDGDAQPMFQAGHDIAYFSALPEINRALGLVQLKLVFAAGYEVPLSFTVDVDCILADGGIETRRVTVPAGLRGPCPERVFGEAVLVADVAKMKAELVLPPFRGAGFYRGVADVRLVEPPSAPGCRFTIVTDVPFLASVGGVAIRGCSSTPVAVQVDRPWGNPHLADDLVGQLFLAYTDEGDICLHRRAGVPGTWDEGEMLTEDGISDLATVAKDLRGTLVLVRQRGQRTTRVDLSRDDGHQMEE